MNSPYASIVLIAVLVLLMYFVVLRPQRKRQQQQAQTMRTLEPGTRVMLTSGIYATIARVGEKQIVLETAPGVELTVLKQAVAKVVPAGEEDDDTAYAAVEDDRADLDDLDDSDDFDAVEEPVRSEGYVASDGPQRDQVARSAFDDSTAPSWPPTSETSSDPMHETPNQTNGSQARSTDAVDAGTTDPSAGEAAAGPEPTSGTRKE